MHIDKYKNKDGEYIDEDDCSWMDAEDFLQGKLLGFCCCGDATENIKYVAKILRHIHNLIELVHQSKKLTYKDWVRQGQEIGSYQSLYFAYYFLDKIGFTNHGSAVPGWVTKEGIEFMEDAESLYSDNQKGSDKEGLEGKG